MKLTYKIPAVSALKIPKPGLGNMEDPYAKAMSPQMSGLVGALKQGKRVSASKFSSKK